MKAFKVAFSISIFLVTKDIDFAKLCCSFLSGTGHNILLMSLRYAVLIVPSVIIR